MNLTNKIFHDDEAARLHLEAQRWPDGAYCPHCGECEKVTVLKGKSTKPGTYICKSCRTKFTVTVGTLFERSHVRPGEVDAGLPSHGRWQERRLSPPTAPYARRDLQNLVVHGPQDQGSYARRRPRPSRRRG